jgi:hypothetical protein
MSLLRTNARAPKTQLTEMGVNGTGGREAGKEMILPKR